MNEARNINKRVLITGASSGIGAQLAKDYLDDGWTVYGCGRSSARLMAITGIEPLVFDITVREGVQSAGRRLANLLQKQSLDLIILNAGDCEYIDDPLAFDDKLFERVIRTNLIATGYCLNAFLPLLSPQGQLALMSSSAAYLPLPRAEAYGASKAGLNYLARTLAVSFGAKADTAYISVSLICPGFVATALTAKNDFPMPMCLSVEQASVYIQAGLAARQAEIHFPRRFTFALKLLALLPAGLWRYLVGRALVNTSGHAGQQVKNNKDVTQ